MESSTTPTDEVGRTGAATDDRTDAGPTGDPHEYAGGSNGTNPKNLATAAVELLALGLATGVTVLLVGQRAVPAATKAAAVAALTVGALLVGPALVARLERAAGFADGASPSGRRC